MLTLVLSVNGCISICNWVSLFIMVVNTFLSSVCNKINRFSYCVFRCIMCKCISMSSSYMIDNMNEIVYDCEFFPRLQRARVRVFIQTGYTVELR